MAPSLAGQPGYNLLHTICSRERGKFPSENPNRKLLSELFFLLPHPAFFCKDRCNDKLYRFNHFVVVVVVVLPPTFLGAFSNVAIHGLWTHGGLMLFWKGLVAHMLMPSSSAYTQILLEDIAVTFPEKDWTKKSSRLSILHVIKMLRFAPQKALLSNQRVAQYVWQLTRRNKLWWNDDEPITTTPTTTSEMTAFLVICFHGLLLLSQKTESLRW